MAALDQPTAPWLACPSSEHKVRVSDQEHGFSQPMLRFSANVICALCMGVALRFEITLHKEEFVL
jgi:hypothetical protein